MGYNELVILESGRSFFLHHKKGSAAWSLSLTVEVGGISQRGLAVWAALMLAIAREGKDLLQGPLSVHVLSNNDDWHMYEMAFGTPSKTRSIDDFKRNNQRLHFEPQLSTFL